MAKKTYFCLILISLLGLSLRYISINQSLWLDEAVQAILSSKSVTEILFHRQGDFHPPLFYLIAHYWQLISHTEIWLRSLTILFGTATIPAIYYLSRKWIEQKSFTIFNREVDINLLSAFLLSISPFHIYYSQEYRSYSLLCLLTVMSGMQLKNIIINPSKINTIYLGVINALIMYTHYSGIFFIVTEIVFIFIHDKKYIKHILYSILISGLLFTPWFPKFIEQLFSGINIDNYLPGWRNILSLPTFTSLPITIFKLIAGRINILSKNLYLLYVLFVIFYFFACTILSIRTKLYLWALLPIVLMIIVSIALPQTQPFRLIYTLPWIILIISQTAYKSPKTVTFIAIYIFLFGLILYSTRPRLQREQWRPAGEYLQSKNTTIIFKFPEPFAPLQWYQPNLNYISSVKTFPGNSSEISLNLDIHSLPNTVLVIDYLSDLTDPGRETEKYLEGKRFVQSDIKDFIGVGFIKTFTRNASN